MNFLQLCQRGVTECGVAGVLNTTFGQAGSLARIVNWIGDAWNELQTEREEWDWMRSSAILGAGVSFIPAANQYSTPLGMGAGTLGVPTDSFGKWDEETFRCFTTLTGTSDEMFLEHLDFDVWRDGYMLGAMRKVQTRPYVFAIGPDQSINLGPPPNGLYTITGDFWMAPTLMVLDADVPIGLPTRLHMLIVYSAMKKYGFFESADEVLERATAEYDKMHRQLLAARLPRMGFGGSL